MKNRKNWKNYIAFGLIFLFQTSCLQSPLLKHKNAEDKNPETVSSIIQQPMHYGVSFRWDISPQNGEGEFLIHIWDRATATSSGPYTDPPGEVKVFLWMPEHGHGSRPVMVTQEKDAQGLMIPGVYRATHVYFSMPGRWDIHIRLMEKDPVKVFDELIMEYEH